MAEAIVARERKVSSTRNAVSNRTLSFDSDVRRAIVKRADSLRRRYGGYNGRYRTAEEVTDSEVRNMRRINRAVYNMIFNRED